MATLTLTQMIEKVRYETLDADVSNYALVDADITILINQAYVAAKAMQDDRTQFVSGAATGAVASVANGGVCLLSAVNIRRIVRLYLASSSASSTPSAGAMEQWDGWRAWKERAESPATGQPTAFAAVRQGTATAANVGKWLLVFWRIPDATYDYVMEAVLEPTPLSSGTDKPDVDDATSYAIAWMAASVAARLLGRSSEFIAHIESKIPSTLKAAYEQMKGTERTP